MEEVTKHLENTYNNTLAFKEMLKMMKRQELITVSFILDTYGFEAISVESKRIDKFNLQLSNLLFRFLFRYLEFGEIIEPLPSPDENLLKGNDKNSNEFATDVLKRIIKQGLDEAYMHIVPEIVDKPGQLTVTFSYPYGCIVFMVERNEEIGLFLESRGY